ncbi:large subunit GTPase 1 homolog [Erpetoichthys calabaricus]|uniref:Large subunit GTPase 1 homolog n=1 Tax=Erpetoichthys calabaricus TaxID=27687 RepID=A0A8C4X6Q1_ERPCA|nr:large subunit GTPase 1 homolog [Erpetoichthys calabaricus]
MGKKKSSGGGSTLGRTLIKHKNLTSFSHRKTGSWLHTSELNDGYDWGRLNLQSVTEQSSMDEFLATAELAGTEFVAEKLNIKFVPAENRSGLLTTEEMKRIHTLQEENKHFLRIPRRPYWDQSTSAEALEIAERDSFLEWRRTLAQLEEQQKLILTPFERNLDFWRQLWRVIEKSDIVVQIVDARNPLLFRCQDLESYVKEVSVHKENMLLINKADLLTQVQRRAWARYFEKEGIRAVFWSALAEAKRLEDEEKEEELEVNVKQQTDSKTDTSEDDDQDNIAHIGNDQESLTKTNSTARVCQDEEESDQSSDIYEDCEDEDEWKTCSEDENSEGSEFCDANDFSCKKTIKNSSHLLHKDELLKVFRAAHSGPCVKEGHITVGLVGYPNVGKSSTINTILRNKKVSVSATPGHTKHFQTLFVEPGLCLCDCPGLVMPSFVSTKAEMICSGILPIDQIRDHMPPISLVCQHIPRHVLEATYGIKIVHPREDEDPDRPPTAEELLAAYGYMRGFMTAHGQPDQPRSARYILKDYVNGKLLYCYPPPHINPADFQPKHSRIEKELTCVDNGYTTAQNKTKPINRIENPVDKNFFSQDNVRALTRGVQSVMGYHPGGLSSSTAANTTENILGKPWKKHGNRNKKEKTRRLNKHLDA